MPVKKNLPPLQEKQQVAPARCAAAVPFIVTVKGIELYALVTPKASETRVGEIMSDSKESCALRVYVNAPPENNQANKAVCELLSKELKIPKSCVSVVHGATSRSKTLLLQGVTVEHVTAYLETL
jgi:uncharacterized protein YggU (UPF0235/DUF167 family)